MLKLTSSTNEIFEVELNSAIKSALIKNIIEDCGTEDTIPLEIITSNTLRKVIEYLQKDLPTTSFKGKVESNDIKIYVSYWESIFIDVSIDDLKDLIIAANFLDIPSLLTLCSIKFACILYGKSASQMRSILNEEDDLDPIEVQKIRKRYENDFN
jgi:S-phase kinase-associated protein 1